MPGQKTAEIRFFSRPRPRFLYINYSEISYSNLYILYCNKEITLTIMTCTSIYVSLSRCPQDMCMFDKYTYSLHN